VTVYQRPYAAAAAAVAMTTMTLMTYLGAGGDVTRLRRQVKRRMGIIRRRWCWVLGCCHIYPRPLPRRLVRHHVVDDDLRIMYRDVDDLAPSARKWPVLSSRLQCHGAIRANSTENSALAADEIISRGFARRWQPNTC